MKKRLSFSWLTVLLFFVPLLSIAQQKAEDPDPLRFKDEINTFVRWDEKNSYPRDAILFTGSSSIRMWKTHLAFPDLPVINRGFGGSHISDVLYYYPQIVLKYQPQLIVFYAGDNDIAADKSVEQVFNDYKEFISRLQTDLPEVRVIYLPIKPSISRAAYWKKMQEVNDKVKEFNNGNDHLFYLDTAAPLLKTDGTADPDLFLRDGLHLNDKGYSLWNSALLPLLEKLYQNPASRN